MNTTSRGDADRSSKLDALAALESALKQLFAARQMKPDAQTVAAWVAGLMADGVTIQQACEALRQFTINSTDFPSVAAVRNYLPGMLGLTADERAGVAWGAVVKAVRRFGRYASWNFDDPVVNAAVRMIGGQSVLCSCDEGELHFREKSFRSAYAACLRTGAGDARPLLGLAGHHERIELIETGLPPTDAGRRLRIAADAAAGKVNAPLIEHATGTALVATDPDRSDNRNPAG